MKKAFKNMESCTLAHTQIHIYLHHLIPGAQVSQKSASDLQDKALKVVLSHLMWMLGTKFGYPTAALLLSQIPNSPICHYNVEDEDTTLMFLSSIT